MSFSFVEDGIIRPSPGTVIDLTYGQSPMSRPADTVSLYMVTTSGARQIRPCQSPNECSFRFVTFGSLRHPYSSTFTRHVDVMHLLRISESDEFFFRGFVGVSRSSAQTITQQFATSHCFCPCGCAVLFADVDPSIWQDVFVIIGI